MSIEDIFFEFVNAINEHDIDKIYSLMTDDHIFIDAWGRKTNGGKEEMKNGWTDYFNLFPDYKIEITDTYSDENRIAVFGFASGTFENRKTETNENYWKLPAAWQAIIEIGKIKLWQVCADQKKVIEILEKNGNMNFS
jgi:ketosteroid isomerase-like protein